MNDQFQTIQFFKNMETIKISGYQKLKAEIDTLKNDIQKLIYGTEAEKAEVTRKYSTETPVSVVEQSARQ